MCCVLRSAVSPSTQFPELGISPSPPARWSPGLLYPRSELAFPVHPSSWDQIPKSLPGLFLSCSIICCIANDSFKKEIGIQVILADSKTLSFSWPRTCLVWGQLLCLVRSTTRHRCTHAGPGAATTRSPVRYLWDSRPLPRRLFLLCVLPHPPLPGKQFPCATCPAVLTPGRLTAGALCSDNFVHLSLRHLPC